MRAVVWNREWDDEYDDLSSIAPNAKAMREPLPAPPLPPCCQWRDAVRLPSWRKRRISAEVMFAGSIVCLSALVLSPFVRYPMEPYEWAFIYVVLALISVTLGFMAIKTWIEGSVANQEVRWLARDVGVEHGYPLRVTIYQDGHLTGVDEGIAYFAHDALIYHGLQCDFTVGAQDLRFDPHMAHSTHGWRERGFVIPELSLRHPDRKIKIAFEPYTRMCKKDERDCAFRFRRDLHLFLHNWRASHEPSLYPPLELHPAIGIYRRKAAIVSAGAPAKR